MHRWMMEDCAQNAQICWRPLFLTHSPSFVLYYPFRLSIPQLFFFYNCIAIFPLSSVSYYHHHH